MVVSEKGLELIKHYESFRAKPYKCQAGVWTIGYGTTETPQGLKINAKTKPISEEVATKYLMHDINTIRIPYIEKFFKGLKLDQNLVDALVSWCYNFGSFRWYDKGGNPHTYSYIGFLKHKLRVEQGHVLGSVASTKDIVDVWADKCNYRDPSDGKMKQSSGLRRRRMSEVILAFSGELTFFVSGSWSGEKPLYDNYALHTGRYIYDKLDL